MSDSHRKGAVIATKQAMSPLRTRSSAAKSTSSSAVKKAKEKNKENVPLVSSTQKKRSYTCRACGQPKKGHICTVSLLYVYALSHATQSTEQTTEAREAAKSSYTAEIMASAADMIRGNTEASPAEVAMDIDVPVMDQVDAVAESGPQRAYHEIEVLLS